MDTLGKLILLAAGAGVAVFAASKIIKKLNKDGKIEEDIQTAYRHMKARWCGQSEDDYTNEKDYFSADFGGAKEDGGFSLNEDEDTSYQFLYEDDDFGGSSAEYTPPATDAPFKVKATVDTVTEDFAVTVNVSEAAPEADDIEPIQSSPDENAELSDEELMKIIEEEIMQDDIQKLVDSENNSEEQ
ncbi:MAG: hypothetical protein LBL82_06990 [Oscillospiraceae bacterium]|jgi:hypothetical protein|nr:hypothetical protein [Oscillospiraceae bacterium]